MKMRVALIALAALALPSCGLRPLYAGGEAGPVVQTLRGVQVAPIPGQNGWLVRTALQDRLGRNSGAEVRYRLEVELSDDITGFGIRSDNAVTRERRTLRARYRLIDAQRGTVVLDATAGSDAGVDVVSSEYATVAAEQTAIERLSTEVADQIVSRLALYARRGGRRPRQPVESGAMKANRGQVEKALKAPAATRFFLLHGQDDSGSRALARLLGAGLGPDAERIDLSGAELKADPARLADEAASLSMFGGARWILVDPAGDETVPAVEALLEVQVAGNPVILLAGSLKPASKLLKLALAAADVLAFASYAPNAGEADKLAVELARAEGLILRPDLARRIAESCGGNRALIAQELAKFALYAGATPDAPKAIDHDVIDALGADSDEGDLSRLVGSAADGDAAGLEDELARLHAEGQEGIPLLRAMLRRMALLARLRAEVEQGNSPSAVMASSGKSLFWKEKDEIGRQLGRWRADLLAKAMARLLEAERQVKASGGIGPLAADEELFAICRQAARLR